MKELRIPVVKVKSYLEDEVIGYGSGVFLSDGYVLTASHTLRGDRHVIMLDEAEKETFVKNPERGWYLWEIRNARTMIRIID